MVDSSSRWAEALREISSRLEEMPGEEGYPTYLPSRLASFYERAGAAECLGADGRTDRSRSWAPSLRRAADFSEPVTQSTMRVAGALWALDYPLAHSRHYPAINWNRSYSLYVERLAPWFREHVGKGWPEQAGEAGGAAGARRPSSRRSSSSWGPTPCRRATACILEAAGCCATASSSRTRPRRWTPPAPSRNSAALLRCSC